MNSLPAVKTGTSFIMSCEYKQEGVAVSVAGLTIRSQVRNNRGTLIANLLVKKANQTTNPGVFTLESPAQPQFWPVGKLFCDILFIGADNQTLATMTFVIPIEQSITKQG